MAKRNYYDVKTPEFRLSYPHLFEPYKFEDETQGSYSLVMMFERSADLKPLDACPRPSPTTGQGAPGNVRSPFCDGNEKVASWGESFRDTIFVRAKTLRRPPVVDARGMPVEDPELAYPGCYCRAVVTPIVYDKAGNRGVRIQLAAVQILRDGERLDGDGGARALEMLGVDVAAGAPDLSFDPDDRAASARSRPRAAPGRLHQPGRHLMTAILTIDFRPQRRRPQVRRRPPLAADPSTDVLCGAQPRGEAGGGCRTSA